MWTFGILLSLSSLASSYVIIENDELIEGVIWPSEYHLKAETIDIMLSIRKPFEIWYSAELNRSRISYYDGVESIYYYGKVDDEYGFQYKIYTSTSATLIHTEQCDKEGYGDEAEDFLPSIDNLKYSGDKIYNNKTVSVWELNDHKAEEITKVILYVYRHADEDYDVPVRYVYKQYSGWTKALMRYTITEYYNFQLPDSYDLDAENVASCNDTENGINLKKPISSFHPNINSGLDKAFHAYKHHHMKQYDLKEHAVRRQIFQNNLRKVIEHNKKNLSYKMELNKFSDRTPDELRYLAATSSNPLGKGSVEFPHTEEELKAMVEDLPENYNMKLDGVISRVKNQGNCGSCWAYSTTAAVEGALARSNGGRNIDLSEQSLVDCAWGFHNYGCEGGLLDSALNYVLEYGIPTEREYGPYLEQNGYCNVQNMTKVHRIKGFGRVPPLSVNAMKVALYKYGPVAVAINAGENLLQYSSGVFFDPECEGELRINHGVVVVGYGVRDGILYWIVKNSWGEEWGQDGYVLMSATNDNCLVLTEAYYPII